MLIGNTEVALILIEHGADYNVRFYDGKTMLHCAAENGNSFHLFSDFYHYPYDN